MYSHVSPSSFSPQRCRASAALWIFFTTTPALNIRPSLENKATSPEFMRSHFFWFPDSSPGVTPHAATYPPGNFRSKSSMSSRERNAATSDKGTSFSAFWSHYIFHYSRRPTKKSFPTDTGKPFIFHEILVGAVGIESTSCMETKEFCGAPWPSK